jgi:sulfatase maturation enzyme AslB (radical SAM superfamily)
MAVIIAGFRGGIAQDTTMPQTAHLARRILDGSATTAEVLAHLESHPWPRTLSLVVNNACNLKCRHCYLQVDELTEPALTIEEWEKLLKSVAATGVHLVTLAGKEVFLGNMGRQILELLTSLRKASDGPIFRTGIVSNGTLLAPSRDLLLTSDLSYLDISVDGLPADHDAIRGAGAFERALPNIHWAVSEFGPDFHVTCTLQKQNASSIVKIARFFDAIGVQNLGFGFYHPLPYTDGTLQLQRGDLDSIFESLSSLEFAGFDQLRCVNLDVGMIEPSLFDSFLRSDWFDLDRISADKSGEVFIGHILPNGLKLNFRFAPFPTSVYLSARITPEGNYLAPADTLNAKLYGSRVLCTARESGFDFSRMHAQGLASPRLRQLIDEHSAATESFRNAGSTQFALK